MRKIYGIPGILLSILAASGILFPVSGCGGDEELSKPNVILVSIDTLRADHLGCYGYERNTSPFLDLLAEREGAVLFENCIAPAPSTAPSHMSLFTSLLPGVHGVPNVLPNGGANGMRHVKATKPLAYMLMKNGYTTAAITDGGNLDPSYGFDEGFETYVSEYTGVKNKVDSAISWLDQNAGREKPYFLFIHTYEVHAPYLPPAPFDEMFTGDYDGWVRDVCMEFDDDRQKKVSGFASLFKKRKEFTGEDVAYLAGLYDGEIAYTDREVERFWKYLEENGLTENLVFVFLSDHGEEFGEHGEFNHKQLYDEVVRVPLIMVLPQEAYDITENRIEEQVALIDVMPTVLKMASVAPPAYLQGTDLGPLWEGRGPAVARPAFSEIIDFDAVPRASSVRFEGKKFVMSMNVKHLEFFDLANDPEELENRVLEMKRDSKRFFQLLKGRQIADLKLRRVHKAVKCKRKASEELAEELKQLGY